MRRALERLEQPDEVRVDLGRAKLQPEGELDLVAVWRLGLGLGLRLGLRLGLGFGLGLGLGLGPRLGMGLGLGSGWRCG